MDIPYNLLRSVESGQAVSCPRGRCVNGGHLAPQVRLLNFFGTRFGNS